MFGKLKKKLKEKLDKMNQDDRGSAFIFVVIGVMFVSIVGATVLSVATNYVTTVIVDHYSTDNFYQTEGYLSEVRSGIEEIAGEVNEKSYLEVVEKYTAAEMTGKIKTIYGKKYLTGIVRELNGGALQPTEETQEIKDIETTFTTAWEQLSISKIKEMTTNPDSISSSYAGGDLRYRFVYDSDKKELSLVIRGLVIKYTDETGYHSDVQTDIKIDVPDYSFEGDDTFEQLKHYISISDDILSVENTIGSSASGGMNLFGNIYSGGAKEGNDASGDTYHYESGIEVQQGTKASFNSKQIISRGDFNIYSGAVVNMNGLNGLNNLGDLWVRNIALKQPLAGSELVSNVNINENAYVLDDLSIEDNQSTVNLGGNYYGYSYNEQNDASLVSQRSDYSSAILINGKNTTLTSYNLTKLILSGRTFVQRNISNDGGTTFEDSVDDIMMGESLAVKSNQIAYLVPDKYIVGEHNPLAKDEIDPDDIMKSIKKIEFENDTNIWPYLDQSNPITANFNNAGKYVFLYLNFASEVKANEYFSNYYSSKNASGVESNRLDLEEKAQTYISTSDGEGMKISPGLYLIAGNIIHNYYASDGSSKQQSPNYYDGMGTPNSVLLADGKSKMKNYLGLQLSLMKSGSESATNTRYELLPQNEQNELVCDVVLNIDTGGKYTADDNEFRKGTEALPDVERDVPGYSGWKLICKNDSYDVPADVDKGIILCAENVTLSSDFEGLIISGGTVKMVGSGTYKANVSVVGEILEMIRKNEELSKYFRCLDHKDKNSVNVADCISYENWERNSN